MKKLFKKALIGMMVLSLSATALAKEKIYVGTNAEFPPFEYLEKGEITGFDIELMNEMGKVLDAEVKVQDMAFDGLLPALQMKKVDVVIAGMTATEERKKTVAFTQPYYTASQVIIVKEGDNSIKSFDDLKGKKIGVQLATTGDIYAKDDFGEENVEEYNKGADAVMALTSGKIDAVIIDNQPAKAFVKTTDGLQILDTDYVQEDYAAAIQKGNTDLLNAVNGALKELKEDGTIQKILDKYIK